MLRLVIEVCEAIPELDLQENDLVVVEIPEGSGRVEVSVTRDRPPEILNHLLRYADSPALQVLSSSPPSLPLYLRELSRLAGAQPHHGHRLRLVL